MSRILTAIVVCLLLAAAVQCLGAAVSVEKFGDNARIDWTNGVYVATGSGAMPSVKQESHRGRAYLKAKGYAQMDALANLLMAIEGTKISYEATGKDYMADVTIRQHIQGFVKNAVVTKTWTEQVEGDKIVMVEVRAPMYGASAPAQVFLSGTQKAEPAVSTKHGNSTGPITAVVQTNVRVILKPDKPAKVKSVAVSPASDSRLYTGVIVDCSGYKIDRCMSPKIRRPDGSEVWGTIKVDANTVLDRGIVAYTTSLADAMKHSRAGSRPLVISAQGRGGGRFFSDPIISDANADLLLAENQRSGFMDKLNVIFVKDPKVY